MDDFKMQVRINPVYYVGITVLAVVCLFILMNTITEHKNIPTAAFEMESIYSNRKLNTQNSINLLPDVAEAYPIMTLMMTTGRSGSTWVGKLLDLIDESFYLYEPIHALRMKGFDFTTGFRLVEQLLHCGITTDFADELRNWPAMNVPKFCSKGRHYCTSAKAIATECQNAKYRSMKIIRLRLSLVENLLVQTSLKNLKIIFLVRDPRATMHSIQDVKLVDRTWENYDAVHVCSKLREDIYSYQILSRLYPNNFYLLRYEDMALDPTKKAKEIWSFINDKRDYKLPTKWHPYLKKSQVHKTRVRSPFDTEHKSTQDWQQWRQKIDTGLYDEVIEKCDDVIEVLGYKPFGSFTDVRNSTQSSLSVEICHALPCKSS